MINLWYSQLTGRMCTVHMPVFKLLGGGCFEAFHPAEVTYCTDVAKSTLPRQISPLTWIYNMHISTLVMTCLWAK